MIPIASSKLAGGRTTFFWFWPVVLLGLALLLVDGATAEQAGDRPGVPRNDEQVVIVNSAFSSVGALSHRRQAEEEVVDRTLFDAAFWTWLLRMISFCWFPGVSSLLPWLCNDDNLETPMIYPLEECSTEEGSDDVDESDLPTEEDYCRFGNETCCGLTFLECRDIVFQEQLEFQSTVLDDTASTQLPNGGPVIPINAILDTAMIRNEQIGAYRLATLCGSDPFVLHVVEIRRTSNEILALVENDDQTAGEDLQNILDLQLQVTEVYGYVGDPKKYITGIIASFATQDGDFYNQLVVFEVAQEPDAPPSNRYRRHLQITLSGIPSCSSIFDEALDQIKSEGDLDGCPSPLPVDPDCRSGIVQTCQEAVEAAVSEYDEDIKEAQGVLEGFLLAADANKKAQQVIVIANCAITLVTFLAYAACVAAGLALQEAIALAARLAAEEAFELALEFALSKREDLLDMATKRLQREVYSCIDCLTAPPTQSPMQEPGILDRIASLWGDPHIITFDKVKYDCQALGDVVLLKSLDSNFEIQGRFVPFRASSFPTIISGFAVKDDGIPTLQITRHSNGNLQFYVDGIVSAWEDGERFSVDGGRLILDSGVSIALSGWHFAVGIPPGYKSGETLIGILGSPNGDPLDDWMARDGAAITVPTSRNDLLFQPAYDYCTTNWCVQTAEESIFTYEEGTSFEEDYACDATRSYNAALENALQNPPSCLTEICGDSLECLIDGIVGGREGAIDVSSEPLLEDPCVPSSIIKPCYFSCAEALSLTCDTTSGVVPVCPLGDENDAVDVYCDQETTGGGWMLLYSYNHERGNNDELQPNLIPSDPDDGYSHFPASSVGYSALDIESIRFYCRTSAHDRVVHFMTDHPVVKDMALEGEATGNSPVVWNDFQCFTVELEGHTAFLPRSTNSVLSNNLWYFPFFTSATYHWAIRANYGGFRYECDDIGGGVDLVDTLHNVWVRMRE